MRISTESKAANACACVRLLCIGICMRLRRARAYLYAQPLMAGKWPVSCDYIQGNEKWRGNCEIYLKEWEPLTFSLAGFICLCRLVFVFRSLVDLPVYTYSSLSSYGPVLAEIIYSLWDFCSFPSFLFLLRYPLATSHAHFLFLVSSHFPFQLNVFIIKSCYRISPLKLLKSIAQCVTVYYACIDGGLEVMLSTQTQPFFLSQFVFKHSGAHSFLVWSMKWLIQPTSPSIQVTTLKHYRYSAFDISFSSPCLGNRINFIISFNSKIHVFRCRTLHKGLDWLKPVFLSVIFLNTERKKILLKEFH